ncbi:outer membrane receptor for ferric coprogen and ferric-rhodotorulic acid [Pseudoduganella lurida]|uniref:Outer membrane receptor for ferric coprogen and ferric-rhodotorulic acid n=1 Tax=Pseudoduganella lurida TaxID=1036180 RepID=A0A562R384_9BURK|nr:TonB-dependent siderophore receptor [Pseudoduganella lurida]TWI63545.1 outer membrane receptor for ferric coprogen and ferric-rhodotorulic acid [Pseudoduganella lurida]
MPAPIAHLRPTAAALAAALLCGAAHAAPDPAPEEQQQQMTTVVVQGSAIEDSYTVKDSKGSARLDLSLRETPQSVSVITRAQLDDFRLDTVNDMLATTTGVTVERVENDRTYYTARGFDITNFQYDGVGIPFVSGLVQGDLDTVLYDRVDVVRGANGLMSGTGNPSATVNFIRKRPTSTFQASAALTYGSHAKKRAEADISGALNEAGTVTGRIVAAYQDGDSYIDRYSADRKVFYGVIEAKLAQDTTLTVGHSSQISDTKGGMWGALPLYYTDLTPTDLPVGYSTAADWTRNHFNDQRTFVELVQRFGNGWRAQATLARNTTKNDGKLFYTYGTPDRATGFGLFSYPSLYASDNRQTLAEASATGQFTLGGRRHDLTFGANWSRSTLDDVSHYGQGIGTALVPLDQWTGVYPEPAFDAGIDGSAYVDRRKSAFVAARFDLADPLKLITGVTHTKADSTGNAYGVTRFKSAAKTTPYLGLTYELAPALTAYTSYTEIFNPQSETDITGATLAPMEGRTREAGVKGEWFDGRLNAAAAVYKTKQLNTAEQAGMVGVKAYYRGVDAEAKGFEFDLGGELAKGLQASAGFSVLHLEDEQGNAARTYVPRRTLRFSATYQLPAVPKLRVGASATWQDDIYRNEADGAVIRQPSYAVLGLMARYEIDRQLSLAVNVNNLADKKYLTSLYWSQALYAAPRTASATLNWKY